MSLNALRKGQHVKIGATKFLVLQKLAELPLAVAEYRHRGMVCIY